MRSSMSRNESIRERLDSVVKSNGIKLKFMAIKVGISNTTISSWRTGSINFMDEKLNTIEKFIRVYE
jgi:transcriptional regulator with XRE-family HTH domain